jgi:hypothetical protein
MIEEHKYSWPVTGGMKASAVLNIVRKLLEAAELQDFVKGQDGGGEP